MPEALLTRRDRLAESKPVVIVRVVVEGRLVASAVEAFRTIGKTARVIIAISAAEAKRERMRRLRKNLI